MKVPFFDRTRAEARAEADLTAAFLRVLRSGQYILGGEVAAFEQAVAAYLGVEHAIGVSSGTDAILVALLSLGVGPGDEVICPSYTFFATASAIARAGATPVLADIDPVTFNLDPAAVADRITPRTRAVVPVHLFGRPADLDSIRAAAGAIPIIEDAAQAIGASAGGAKVGSIGAAGCFSFFPSKSLGGFGDGGLVTTRDPALADRARTIRVHGAKPKNHHRVIGGNYRLDAIQAALLGVGLPRLPEALARRAAIAARYEALFGDAGLAGAALVLPRAAPGVTFNQYVVRVRDAARERLRAFLAERGVGTEVYYPLPLHLQPALAHLGHAEGAFPVAEAAAKETLALPIFPELLDDEQAYVVDQIVAFFAG